MNIISIRIKIYLKIFFLFTIFSISYGNNKLDLGFINPETMIKTYPDFYQSLDKALIGIPGSILENGQDFYGRYEDIKNLNFISGKKAPLVIYMHGSGRSIDQSIYPPKLKWNYDYSLWFTQAGYIFIALDSYAIQNRPSYSSPVSRDKYKEVNDIRQAEITQASENIIKKSFVNINEMYLLGISEGAVAAARYSGKEFKGRMVLSWSCEPSYMTEYAKIGASIESPFLNIMGERDFYYGKNAPYNSMYARNTGNCSNHLSVANYQNSKVLIYPDSDHNITYNKYTKNDLLDFMSFWVGRSVKSNQPFSL